MGNYTVGSLFAGIGGFCRAFEKKGFKVAWANDLDERACETYSLNYPGTRLIGKSITDLSVALDSLEQVDVITAGFPCQPFSVAGDKQGFDDPRGKTFFEISRLIDEFGDKRPKIILMENVYHILNHNSGKSFSRIIDEIQGCGYWFSKDNAEVLNTGSHTKIPQRRERLYMAALSVDHFPYNSFSFPPPINDTDDFRKYLDLHEKQDEWHYFDLEGRWGKLFVEAMAKGDENAPYQLRRYYVREMKNNLIPALTANMGEGGHNQPVIKDQWGIRKFTVDECLRFQGFGVGFNFPQEMPISHKYRQVGNSVTVPLVERLAAECKRVLDEISRGDQ